jgi:penicillin-binding protein 1A
MQVLREDKTRLQAGFLAMEPGTGLVRAWVGSRDFALDQFDHVGQARRQPGSTFKPFVYGAAFELGARPTDLYVDQPVEIPLDNGQIWRPSDIGAPTLQPFPLREALAYSKNTITAQLMQRLGAPKVAQLAQAMGVRDSRLTEVISLGLGTSPVTLREMVSAYGTIANDGQYVPPRLVLQVEDRHGKVLQAFPAAAPEAALASAANGLLLDAMRGVVTHGTGAAIRAQFGLQGELAGKTGTTQDNTDGWFLLMHPQLVAGAWVGYNDARVTMPDAWGQGARSALPMVGEFMQQSLRARLLDAKARFPAAADPVQLEPMNAWWATMFPPPLQELATLPPGDVTTTPVPAVVIGPNGGMPATAEADIVFPRVVERAIVVTPGGSPVPHVVVPPPSERAVVVAPPRPAPRGEASGAGPPPRPARGPDFGNSYINP